MEQYFDIVHPLLYKSRLRAFRARYVMGVVWLIGISFTLAYATASSDIILGYCQVTKIFPNAIAANAVGIFVLLYYIIPALLMIGCFCHMTIALRWRMTKTAPAGAKETFGRAKMNIVKTLVLFLATVIVCWAYNIWTYSQVRLLCCKNTL